MKKKKLLVLAVLGLFTLLFCTPALGTPAVAAGPTAATVQPVKLAHTLGTFSQKSFLPAPATTALFSLLAPAFSLGLFAATLLCHRHSGGQAPSRLAGTLVSAGLLAAVVLFFLATWRTGGQLVLADAWTVALLVPLAFQGLCYVLTRYPQAPVAEYTPAWRDA